MSKFSDTIIVENASLLPRSGIACAVVSFPRSAILAGETPLGLVDEHGNRLALDLLPGQWPEGSPRRGLPVGLTRGRQAAHRVGLTRQGLAQGGARVVPEVVQTTARSAGGATSRLTQVEGDGHGRSSPRQAAARQTGGELERGEEAAGGAQGAATEGHRCAEYGYREGMEREGIC